MWLYRCAWCLLHSGRASTDALTLLYPPAEGLGLQEREEGKSFLGSDGLPSLEQEDLNKPLGSRQEAGALPPTSESDSLLLSSEQPLFFGAMRGSYRAHMRMD